MSINRTTVSDRGWQITSDLGEEGARRIAEFDAGKELYISNIFDTRGISSSPESNLKTYLFKERL